MANAFGLLGQQLREIWRHFGINQKVSTVLALLVTVAAVVGVLVWSARPSFRLLYSGMSLEDAARAREKIEDERIPVQLKDSGRAIYVPAADVYRARLLLAAEGLPKDGSTGFELFEEPKFGLTDFAQKVNYQRALQGELARTISAMDGINSARVMLVLPKDKLFASETEKKAKASIMVNVASGDTLSGLQVKSIKQLVGSAVPGLSPSAIMVTDQNGRLLSQGADPSADQIAAAGEQLETQRKMEMFLARKAQGMLDASLGTGRSVVQVSAVLDFSKIERRKETLDAAGRVVVSETISTESTTTPGARAAGGANATVAVGNPGEMVVEQANSVSKKEDIDTQYRIPSGMEHIVENGVRIKSISVSVCVARGDAARTPEELKNVEAMVKTAVGLSESADRKDSIHVTEMTFPEPTVTAAAPWWQAVPFSLQSVMNGLLGMVVLVVVFVMSRRIISRMSIESESAGVPVAALSAGGGMRELGQGSTEPTEGMSDVEQAAYLAEQNPGAIAAWITSVSKGAR